MSTSPAGIEFVDRARIEDISRSAAHGDALSVGKKRGSEVAGAQEVDCLRRGNFVDAALRTADGAFALRRAATTKADNFCWRV